MYWKYIFLLVMAICSFAPKAIALEEPTALELLDKFAQTQDKLRSSFISKLEIYTKFEAAARERPYIERGIVYEIYHKVELRSDGERNYDYHKMWGDRPGRNRTTEEYSNHVYHLWEGGTKYQYTYHPLEDHDKYKNGLVHLTKNRPKRPNSLWQEEQGGALRGYFQGTNERIDYELRQAETISIQSEREEINGSKCYVINAQTKRCEYKIWIDPQHGYNIAKAIIKRGWPYPDRPEDYKRLPEGTEGSAEVELTNVRFKEIDGLWLPVEGDIRNDYQIVTGDYGKTVDHVKITEFVMNPDHDALGSFKHDFIKNGARAYLKGVPGITYTWQDGKLIPNVDKYAIEVIDKIVEGLIAESDVPSSLVRGEETAAVPSTVSDLLKKYAETQDKLRSFIAKGESTIEYIKIPNQSGRMQKELCEFRTDGDRVNHRGSLWDKLLSKDKALYKSFLWDGKSFIQYKQWSQLTDSTVFIEKNDYSKKRMIATEYKGAPLMGICGGDYDRIDSILRKADNISLRQKTEQVGNSQCYVIDAVTKRGKYRVWIDPEHGYNIAKIELQKRKGDLIRSSEHVEIGMLFLLKNVRFEKIDEVWVPVEADMKQYQDDQNRIIKWHHKRTKMTLNPDHNALGSFVPDDIPEGTKVSSVSGEYGREYIWQNGKPVGEVEKDVKF